jgi:hypothetical protein
VSDSLPPTEESPKADVLELVSPSATMMSAQTALYHQQQVWFSKWWAIYWRKVSRKPAKSAFEKHVKTVERFDEVIAATRAQTPEMMSRDKSKQPHPATWLNEERWTDEISRPDSIHKSVTSQKLSTLDLLIQEAK